MRNKYFVRVTLTVSFLASFLFTTASSGLAQQQAQRAKAHFKGGRAEVVIEVDEGGRAETSFLLENKGLGKGYFNIYKLKENEQPLAATGTLAAYKAAKVGQQPTEAKLKQAGLFTGAPWLMQFPYAGVMEPGTAQKVKVSVNTDVESLAPGEHRANLVVVGLDGSETLVMPVRVKVRPAPVLKFDRIEVDDGFSSDTSGNRNHVAEPKEIVAFIVHLKNKGSIKAERLASRVTSLYGDVKSLDQLGVRTPSVAASEEEGLRFLIEVKPEANKKYPPAVVVDTTDSRGRTWSENFYVGEPGKFEYPTGLLSGKQAGEPKP